MIADRPLALQDVASEAPDPVRRNPSPSQRLPSSLWPAPIRRHRRGGYDTTRNETWSARARRPSRDPGPRPDRGRTSSSSTRTPSAFRRANGWRTFRTEGSTQFAVHSGSTACSATASRSSTVPFTPRTGGDRDRSPTTSRRQTTFAERMEASPRADPAAALGRNVPNRLLPRMFISSEPALAPTALRRMFSGPPMMTLPMLSTGCERAPWKAFTPRQIDSLTSQHVLGRLRVVESGERAPSVHLRFTLGSSKNEDNPHTHRGCNR